MQQSDGTACETVRVEQPILAADGVWLFCTRDAEGNPFRVRLANVIGYERQGDDWTVIRTTHQHRASIGVRGDYLAVLDAIFRANRDPGPHAGDTA